MEMVLRALAIYLILLVVFKIAGRRALLQMTSFDLILLLIISEATQQALLGNDFSVILHIHLSVSNVLVYSN